MNVNKTLSENQNASIGEEEEEKSKEDIKLLLVKINKKTKKEPKQDIIVAKQETLTATKYTKETFFCDGKLFL